MNRLAQSTVKIQTILSLICKQSKIAPLVIARRQHKERKIEQIRRNLLYLDKTKKYEFKIGSNRLSPRCPSKEPKTSGYLYTLD